MSVGRRAAEYKVEHRLASEHVGEYLSNPINAYLLVKRLTTDWKAMERLMSLDDISKGKYPLCGALSA